MTPNALPTAPLARRRWFMPSIAALALLITPSAARAGGFELVPPGARSLGRGGASTAGADSPIGVFYNPATAARGDATLDLEFGLHIHTWRRCFEQEAVNESTDPPTGAGFAPEVCGEGPPAVIPALAATVRVNDELAIFGGLYVPPAGARTLRFGDPDTLTFDDDGDPMTAEIPTPTRYMLLEQELLLAFATLGAAYEIHPRVRVGASFGIGFAHVDFATAAYSRSPVEITVLPGLGIEALADAKTTLSAKDRFIPRLQVGAWGQPLEDLPLEVAFMFSWTQNLNARGSLDVETAQINLDPAIAETIVDPDEIEAATTIPGVRLRVPQTAQLAFGFRYAHPLDSPADELGDRMSTELFDVELNLVIGLNKRVDRFTVDLPDDASLTVPSPLAVIVSDTVVPLPDEIALERRWRNQVSLRVGGDVNVIPGTLALRAGFSYESDGVQNGYRSLDFQPFRQIGIHLGGTARIAERIDLTAAFTHMSTADPRVSAQDARVRRTVGGDADPNDPTDAPIQNAGRFRGTANVLVFGATAHF